jgi:hypothetical protein
VWLHPPKLLLLQMTTPSSSSSSNSGIQTFVELWQAQDTLSSHKIAALEDGLKEPPNALALAICLQNLPLKDTAEWVWNASEEEIESHKGLRQAPLSWVHLYSSAPQR